MIQVCALLFLYCDFVVMSCRCVSCFGWLIMVGFGRFGSAGSVCVLCCGGSERSVLVLLRLGFCSCWPCGILMATILWCRGRR